MTLVLVYIVWTYDAELMPVVLSCHMTEAGRDRAIADALEEHETVNWWVAMLED